MKIVVFVPFLNSFGKKGFYMRQEIGLAACLKNKNHDVKVIRAVPVESDVTVEFDNGIEVLYAPMRGIGANAIIDIDVFDKSADILLMFSDTQLFISSVYRWCKNNDVLFLPYCGETKSYGGHKLKNRIRDFIFRLNTVRTYAKCNAVLVKNKAVQDDLRRSGVKRTILCPVGIDLNTVQDVPCSWSSSQFKISMGIDSDEMLILFVGRLVDYKKPIELIEMFREVRNSNMNCHLLIIGDGILKTEVEKRSLADEHITYLSAVPHSEMWMYYSAADFVVNCCSNEIFGMTIVESIYYKTTVLALRAPGPDLLLEQMRGHYICDSFDDIKAHLDYSFVDKQELEQDSKRLVELFSWDNCANAIENAEMINSNQNINCSNA